MKGFSNGKTKILIMTALFAALSCAATMAVKIPSPTGGYMNMGDTVVLLGAYMLGPVYGAAAGGIGTALADLISGYAVYVPATLVIKAVMALTAGLLYKRFKGKTMSSVICGVAGEIPMLIGYLLYDAFLTGSLIGGAAGVPSNLVQACFGTAVSALLTAVLRKNAYVCREFPAFK